MKICTLAVCLVAVANAASIRGRNHTKIFANETAVDPDKIPHRRELYEAHCPKVINDGFGLMRYCRNGGHNIYIDNESVERAIIVIHGSNPIPETYYETTRNEAIAEGVDLDKTDIISPHFFQNNRMPSTGDWRDYYMWDNGWRWGDNDLVHGRSSFDVMDHIITQLIDHRPNLKTIVVAGQSGGGQFVDRYSAGTQITELIPRGIELRFWAANPATYFWLTFQRPNSVVGCPGYNDYPFGFTKRFPYMMRTSASDTQKNAINRKIFRTQAELDTDPYGEDDDCAMHVQGSNHVNVWRNHRAHLAKVGQSYGYRNCRALSNRRHILIRNADHGHKDSWESDIGLQNFFGDI